MSKLLNQILSKLPLSNKDIADLCNIIGSGGGGGSSSNKELYAYPVDTLDGKENKVVGLGGDCQYTYVGELVASEIGAPTEEEVVGEVINTEYLYQPIYDGKYIEFLESYIQEKYITLYIGDDVNGYSSNKVYISEDANNLMYYPFCFVGGFGPRMVEVAISPDYILYYRTYVHYANKNSKVFFASQKQQLDINLIPQEIARKEDIIKEVDNYEYPTVTIDVNTKTYSGQLGSKYINVDANIYLGQYSDSSNKKFHLVDKNNDNHAYENDYGYIIFINKNNTILDFFLKNPILTSSIYDIELFDYKNCNIGAGNCRLNMDTDYPATIDSDDFVTALINGKYLKYKLNRETHLLELQQEIDLSSIESRLAALEAKN